MRHIGYIRVSTELQEIGIEAQREAILNYVKMRQANIYKFYIDENLSGGLPWEKRKGLRTAIEEIDENDIIVVAKRDRLGRDIFLNKKIEDEVLKRGAKVVSVLGEGMGDPSPEGYLLRMICDVFSTYERRITQERIRKAIQVKKERGEVIGGSLTYGTMVAEDGRHLVTNPEEVKIIKYIMSLHKKGMQNKDILVHLNEKNIPMRKTTWKKGTLQHLVYHHRPKLNPARQEKA
jgi:DNA invertase Pin-like site-specific DNA recombinase